MDRQWAPNECNQGKRPDGATQPNQTGEMGERLVCTSCAREVHVGRIIKPGNTCNIYLSDGNYCAGVFMLRLAKPPTQPTEPFVCTDPECFGDCHPIRSTPVESPTTQCKAVREDGGWCCQKRKGHDGDHQGGYMQELTWTAESPEMELRERVRQAYDKLLHSEVAYTGQARNKAIEEAINLLKPVVGER